MLNQLVELINKNVPGAKAVLNSAADSKTDSSITVDASSILTVATWLRSNKEMPFNVLQVMSGVDYVEHMEVCYMFAHFDLENPRELILKTKLTDRVSPSLDSIEAIYPAANYQEREVFDMFGIKFNGHPDLRRILCPDDWQGFPLRKDYIVQKYYNGMEVNPDGKMNFEDREYIVRQEMIKKAQSSVASDVH
jgi:NADH-quinone oxidoreductase subunit C